MSKNAPGSKHTNLGPNPSCQRRCASTDCVRQAGRKESPNSDKAAGGRDHQWWHPELILRRRKSASTNSSASSLLQIGNALPLSLIRKDDECQTPASRSRTKAVVPIYTYTSTSQGDAYTKCGKGIQALVSVVRRCLARRPRRDFRHKHLRTCSLDGHSLLLISLRARRRSKLAEATRPVSPCGKEAVRPGAWQRARV
jgi:hypothetical protein